MKINASATTMTVDRHVIELSHLDKILFPDDGITKGDLINYYHDIAPTMLPYVKGRALTMIRYPHGIIDKGFYQKDIPEFYPAWIERFAMKAEDGHIVHYGIINNAATLVYIANQGCITPHIWLSKMPDLKKPDRMIFDLDPSGKKVDFTKVRMMAFALQDILEQCGLHPFVMTTGSRGMHIVVPLKQEESFDVVREFARAIAQYVVKQNPTIATIAMRKEERGTKIFVDYLRNAQTATAVAPYGVRPKPGAPVATPIDWEEVGDSKLTSQRYNYKTVFKRLEKKGDPWHGIDKHAGSLSKAQKLFKDLEF